MDALSNAFRREGHTWSRVVCSSDLSPDTVGYYNTWRMITAIYVPPDTSSVDVHFVVQAGSHSHPLTVHLYRRKEDIFVCQLRPDDLSGSLESILCEARRVPQKSMPQLKVSKSNASRPEIYTSLPLVGRLPEGSLKGHSVQTMPSNSIRLPFDPYIICTFIQLRLKVDNSVYPADLRAGPENIQTLNPAVYLELAQVPPNVVRMVNEPDLIYPSASALPQVDVSDPDYRLRGDNWEVREYQHKCRQLISQLSEMFKS